MVPVARRAVLSLQITAKAIRSAPPQQRKAAQSRSSLGPPKGTRRPGINYLDSLLRPGHECQNALPLRASARGASWSPRLLPPCPEPLRPSRRRRARLRRPLRDLPTFGQREPRTRFQTRRERREDGDEVRSQPNPGARITDRSAAPTAIVSTFATNMLLANWPVDLTEQLMA
jgi:hypothetical protein